MKPETKKSIRFNTMAIILIIIFCVAISPITLQNDTFYTIKVGEYITENGITMQEPFSWNENLEYTFPHWAYDVLIYSIYNIGGMTGIYISTIVLASILGILIYYINTKLVKNRIISFILTIGTLYLFKPYICARAQLVTFILFILTIYFIEKFLESKKLRYAIGLIIIPILIANLHAATFYFYFILYLPYFAEYVIYVFAYSAVIVSDSAAQSIKKKIAKQGETEELKEKLEKAEKRYNRLKTKEDAKFENPYKIRTEYKENVKWLIIIFIICLFTGLLTPLGNTPYTYLIKTMQGISTKNINEHLPVVLAENKNLLIVFAVYIASIAFTKVKIRLSDLFMIAGLSLLTILSKRQASMLYLIGVIILNRLITQMLSQNGKKTLQRLEEKSSTILGIVLISVVVITISIFQFKPKTNDKYIDENMYPVKAAEWIKENLPISEIKLYNEYNYGSYLIYQGIPVFIDSRCDLYMPEFNDNVYIFKDFLNINNMGITDIESKIQQYGFTHFVVSNSVRFRSYLDQNEDKYKKIYPTGELEDKKFAVYEKIEK